MKRIIKGLVAVVCLFSYVSPRGIGIILDGTSSAGKTSIARELQALCGDSCVYLSVDEEVENPLMRLIVKYLQQKTAERVTNENAREIANKLTLGGVVTQEEIESFSDKLEKSLGDRLTQKIKDLIREGKSVIFEVITLKEQQHVRRFEVLGGNDFLSVLVYCSFQELAKRVATRNLVGGLEQRSFSQAWGQFGKLYKAAEHRELPILDVLSRDTLERLVQLHAQSEFEKERNFVNFTSTLLEDLSLDNNITVQIVPRYKYDLVVDNSKQSSAACAQQIHAFMRQGHEYTALQENYREQRRIRPQRSAWQKFWDFVFCRVK